MKSTRQKPYSCRNCRRVLQWVAGVGWLHTELPQYAHEPITCERAHPVCMYGTCDHADGPDPDCACRCHQPSTRP